MVTNIILSSSGKFVNVLSPLWDELRAELEDDGGQDLPRTGRNAQDDTSVNLTCNINSVERR